MSRSSSATPHYSPLATTDETTSVQKPNTHGFVTDNHDEVTDDEFGEAEQDFDPVLLLRASNPNYDANQHPVPHQQTPDSSAPYGQHTKLNVIQQKLRKVFQFWFERLITCIGFFALAFSTPFPTACSVLYSPMIVRYQASHLEMGFTSGMLKCTHLLAGAFTLSLTRRFGHRKVGTFASIFGIVGFILLYAADSWWILLLSLSILGGLSIGVVRFTLLSGLSRLFSRNISSITYVYAAGIAGSVMMPLIFQSILVGLNQGGDDGDAMAWKNTVLVIGGMCGIFLVTSLLYNVERHTLPTSVFARQQQQQRQQQQEGGAAAINTNTPTNNSTLEQQQLLALTKRPRASKESGKIMQMIRSTKKGLQHVVDRQHSGEKVGGAGHVQTLPATSPFEFQQLNKPSLSTRFNLWLRKEVQLLAASKYDMRLFYILTVSFFTHSRYNWITSTMRFSSVCRGVGSTYFAPGLVVAACGSDFTGKMFMLYVGNCLNLYTEHDRARRVLLGLACLAQLVGVILIPFVAFQLHSFIILIIVIEFSSGLMNHSLPMLFAYGFRDSYNFIGRALALSNAAAGVGVLIFNTISGALVDWQDSFEVAYMFSAASIVMYTFSYIMLELHVQQTWTGAKSWKDVVLPHSPAIKFSKARVVHEFGPNLPPYPANSSSYYRSNASTNVRISVDAPLPPLDRLPGRSRIKPATSPVVIDEAALAQSTLSRAARSASIQSLDTEALPAAERPFQGRKKGARLDSMLGSAMMTSEPKIGDPTSAKSLNPTDSSELQNRASAKTEQQQHKPLLWQELLNYNPLGAPSTNVKAQEEQLQPTPASSANKTAYAPLSVREAPESKPPSFNSINNSGHLSVTSAPAADAAAKAAILAFREANSLASLTPSLPAPTSNNANEYDSATVPPVQPRTRAGTLIFASPTPSVESDYETAFEGDLVVVTTNKDVKDSSNG